MKIPEKIRLSIMEHKYQKTFDKDSKSVGEKIAALKSFQMWTFERDLEVNTENCCTEKNEICIQNQVPIKP